MKILTLGLSPDDGIMGQDSVVSCANHPINQPEFVDEMYWNSPYHVAIIEEEPSKGLSNSAYSIKNDELYCSYNREVVTTSWGFTYDLENDEYHILLATGPVDDEGLVMQHELKSASFDKVSLTTPIIVA